MHWADRMRVVLHPMNYDATILLGPSEGGQGGKDAPDGFPVYGRITVTCVHVPVTIHRSGQCRTSYV